MKYISFVVPSYNSEAYLNKCVDSLLAGGEDVEIIIVNDGSKDRTIDIANEYKEKYPTIIKVIDKENGGHGSGLNAGMDNATGLYFKCVDSDDWVDQEAYKTVLSTIKRHYEENINIDLYLTNFVFERLDINAQKQAGNRKRFPLGEVFTWDKVKRFGVAEYLMMHSVIYKLSILKESNVRCPHHTFYVDNVYLHIPLKYVKTLFYIDVDFYRYYVGRPNQSVTLENMTKNYKMQLKVMEITSLANTYEDLYALPKKHRKFIMHDLIVKSFLTLFYVTAGKSKERVKEHKEYYKRFKAQNKKLYNKLRFRTYYLFPYILIPPLRRWAVMIGYKYILKTTNWN